MIKVTRFDKAPDDNRVYGSDFTKFPEFLAGDTISAASVVPAAGIVVQTPTFANGIVFYNVSGGTAGTTYRLKVLATFASGAILAEFVDIAVITPA